MPAARWNFISCGRACICPHRPSPGWPPYWSSPHHSCYDTPNGKKNTSKGQKQLCQWQILAGGNAFIQSLPYSASVQI